MGFKSEYVTSLLPIYIPKILFSEPSGSIYYISNNLHNIICAYIVSIFSNFYKKIDKRIIYFLTFYIAISPLMLDQSLEIHRYTFLLVGLILIFFSFNYILNNKIKTNFYQKSINLSFFIIGIFLTGISKSFLIFAVIATFISIYIVENIKKHDMNFFKRNIIFIIIISIISFEILKFIFFLILPIHYKIFIYNQFSISFLSYVPLLSSIIKIVYAILSPYPWFNFQQFHLYGYNYYFLIIHILSSITCLWAILSVVINFNKFYLIKFEYKYGILFGLILLTSLEFAAIGHHSYLIPIMPFISLIFITNLKKFKLSFIFIALVFLEIIKFLI